MWYCILGIFLLILITGIYMLISQKNKYLQEKLENQKEVAKIVTKTRKIIANNIVYFRVKKGWSQEYFAELLGTSSGYVSEMENEKRNISSDYIDHIANIFKIEPHELLINRLPVDIRRIDRHKR